MNDEVEKKTQEQAAENDEQNTGSTEAKGKAGKYPALSGYGPPEASKDPLVVLKDILKDKDIDEDGKSWLLEYSVTRFKNRRRMAYLALSAILVSLAFLLLSSIIDGQSTCIVTNECTGVLKNLREVQGLLEWMEGFLAAIVATYYGMSSFRPSS
jgi:hypothetical protein